MLITSVVGARPNFMKVAPVHRRLAALGVAQRLVHTGQHYDASMSKVFFQDLGLPAPDVHLGVGSDAPARQTARIMIAFEEFCTAQRPDLVLVSGDVNSTLAAALVAAKQGIALGHIEAGLRSFDRRMPEELNRVITDQLAGLLFTTEESANQNLRREGVADERIHFVGNCMVDTLLEHIEAALAKAPWQELELEPESYALLTLHRPSNVDDPQALGDLLAAIAEVAKRLPVLFPIHPRTRERLAAAAAVVPATLRICDPLPYLSFLGLMARARLVLTDSGGIQEETTALDVPCLTLRDNTERPVTMTHGSNRLVGTDRERILAAVEEILNGGWRHATRPPLWDGKAADRIVWAILEWLRK